MIGGILDGRVLESLRYRNGTTFTDDAMLKQRMLIPILSQLLIYRKLSQFHRRVRIETMNMNNLVTWRFFNRAAENTYIVLGK